MRIPFKSDIITLLEWLPKGRIRRQGFVLINFLKQLALMLKLQMPITEGISILSQDLPQFFREKIKWMLSDIENGNAISEVLKKHPLLFPKSYLPIIKIGEQSGHLPRMLECCVRYIEQRRTTRQKIMMALVYPGQLIFIAMGIFVFIRSVVIPAFEDVYSTFESPLPLPSKIIFHSFTVFIDYLAPFLFIFGVILFGLIIVRRVIRPVERLLLLLPFFGSLWQKTAETQFCQLFSPLIEDGNDTVYGLEMAKEGVENRYLKYKLGEAIRCIKEEGKTMGEAFEKVKGFSKTLIWTIQLGEQSENLPQTISLITQTYQEDIENLTTKLAVSIEPLIHLVIAIFIGIMVIASYLPIFGMADLILNYSRY